MARALQSTKGERKDIQSRKSNRQDKEHSKKRTEDDEIDHERRRQALHGLAPKLNGLAPNGLTQLLFVAERRTTHRWKACLLADTKSSWSTVSERQGQRKWYSNPARSSIHSNYRPRPRTIQCERGSGWNALVLKCGTLPLRCLFSNTLLAIFDIFFRSKVIHRFVPKNRPKMTCGRVFQHNFISKANFKNPEQGFLVDRFFLLRKQKDCLWQGRFST